MQGAIDVALHIWPLSLIRVVQQFICQPENGQDMCSSDRPMMGAEQFASACRTLGGLLICATPPHPRFRGRGLKLHASSEAREIYLPAMPEVRELRSTYRSACHVRGA